MNETLVSHVSFNPNFHQATRTTTIELKARKQEPLNVKTLQ